MRNRFLAWIGTVVAFATVGVVAVAAPAMAACDTNFSFSSWGAAGHDGKIVSAELSYSAGFYGLLRARTSGSVGPWEKFTRCDYATYSTLKSNANGKYVHVNTAAESGGADAFILRASASSVGTYEKFIFKEGPFSFTMAAVANNLYVSVEYGYYGIEQFVLRARAASAGEWETFAEVW